MKELFPNLHISINGGIGCLEEAQGFLENGLDGVMIGRAAYHTPWDILSTADSEIFGETDAVHSRAEVVVDIARDGGKLHQVPTCYIARHPDPGLEKRRDGGKLHQVTRHMLGLFAGQPGARAWRRTLSERATQKEQVPGARGPATFRPWIWHGHERRDAVRLVPWL